MVAAVKVRPPAFSARMVCPLRSWKVTAPVVVSISTLRAEVVIVVVVSEVLVSKADGWQTLGAVARVVRAKKAVSLAYMTRITSGAQICSFSVPPPTEMDGPSMLPAAPPPPPPAPPLPLPPVPGVAPPLAVPLPPVPLPPVPEPLPPLPEPLPPEPAPLPPLPAPLPPELVPLPPLPVPLPPVPAPLRPPEAVPWPPPLAVPPCFPEEHALPAVTPKPARAAATR